MLYDCKPNIQSQKRCTMDSLKETDKPAPNPSKHPRIEVDEELMRQMIADRPLWIRKSSARFPNRKRKIWTLLRKTHRKRYPEHRHRLLRKQTSTSKRLLERSRPDSGVKRSRCRISNARSSRRWIAVTVRRSMSVRKPSAKCRKSSTCWGMKAQGLRLWSTICCALSWTFTATS